jgi:hypothetical protein
MRCRRGTRSLRQGFFLVREAGRGLSAKGRPTELVRGSMKLTAALPLNRSRGEDTTATVAATPSNLGAALSYRTGNWKAAIDSHSRACRSTRRTAPTIPQGTVNGAVRAEDPGPSGGQDPPEPRGIALSDLGDYFGERSTPPSRSTAPLGARDGPRYLDRSVGSEELANEPDDWRADSLGEH